jgi:hypothetical protein
MHVSEASHAQPTNPKQEMWRWKFERAQAAKDEPHPQNTFIRTWRCVTYGLERYNKLAKQALV